MGSEIDGFSVAKEFLPDLGRALANKGAKHQARPDRSGF